MAISVKVFASLREDLGVDRARINPSKADTARQVWQQITSREPPGNLLCAVNHQYVNLDSRVRDGDEVAFFPPVNGG
ncbi:MAG: MoaD/ThiS family protein [Gammaproteobacteria bacterium]|nr:MoaD/ThiS family protein [Gammaproteobacteria bacterium]MYJ52623.1 MoaD/ThiS family protein [Gammaproteobacteria bacterium]